MVTNYITIAVDKKKLIKSSCNSDIILNIFIEYLLYALILITYFYLWIDCLLIYPGRDISEIILYWISAGLHIYILLRYIIYNI